MKKGYDSQANAKKGKNSVKKGYTGKDIGKKNVPSKTGFAAVASKGAEEYGSAAAGQRVAEAVLKRMKASGKA